MKFGNYYLNQNIEEVIGREEFSADFPKAFADEQTFLAPSTEFLGLEWDTVLGVTSNKIYKIALVLKVYENTERLYEDVKKHFEFVYGNSNDIKKSKYTLLYIWDIDEGNIILETLKNHKNISNGNPLSLFLTAKQPFPINQMNINLSELTDPARIISEYNSRPSNWSKNLGILFLFSFLLIVANLLGKIALIMVVLFIANYIGRKIGLSLTYRVYYSSDFIVYLVGLIWGILIAALLKVFLISTDSSTILTIIGYGVGIYISLPDYGINRRNINFAGFLGFSITSIIQAFL